MLKTIKTTKHMRLDGLLKQCWDNHITSGIYNSNKKSLVEVYDSSNVVVSGHVTANDIFEVTYLEEVTVDTVFEQFIVILSDGYIHKHSRDTLKNVMNICQTPINQIHALINGKLELIWERED